MSRSDTRPETPAGARDGLLLFAHGARDPAWARPFEAIAASLRQQRPGLPIALAYLELMTPDIAQAARELIGRGVTRLQIVPMFLGASGHVRRDVPPLVQALEREHPQVRFELHDAIGEQPAVIAAMAAATLALVELPVPEDASPGEADGAAALHISTSPSTPDAASGPAPASTP